MFLILGVERTGKDPTGVIKINLLKHTTTTPPSAGVGGDPGGGESKSGMIVTDQGGRITAYDMSTMVICRGVDITSVDIKDLALSDHFCVFFDLQITPNMQLPSVSFRKRFINENTSVKFMEAIVMSPTVSAETVDELLDNFNCKISNVIDTIAPFKTKMTLTRQRTPWRNTLMVKALKTECRKAERKWRKTKLQIHNDLYKVFVILTMGYSRLDSNTLMK